MIGVIEMTTLHKKQKTHFESSNIVLRCYSIEGLYLYHKYLMNRFRNVKIKMRKNIYSNHEEKLKKFGIMKITK